MVAGHDIRDGVDREAVRAMEAFVLPDMPVTVERLAIGRIHDTYLASRAEAGQTRRYILQRINTHVFQQPELLMENIRRVTEHLRLRLIEEGREALGRRVLSLIPTEEGQPCWRDDGGHWWRLYSYVENTCSWNVAKTPEIANCGAWAFGDFIRLISDLPAPRLHETIPGFHNTPMYFAGLMRAAEKDVCERAAGARDVLAFVEKREALTRSLSDLCSLGELPERTVHNDTKINNVLFDRDTGEAVCVVDLDTVMPGLVLHDFGDLVRTTVNPAREEGESLEKVDVRLPVFEAVVRGYLDGAGSLLTRRETELMAISGQVITLELGMRFLTDHLTGDAYFATPRPNQNLERARLQFRLLERLESRADEMARIVEALIGQK